MKVGASLIQAMAPADVPNLPAWRMRHGIAKRQTTAAQTQPVSRHGKNRARDRSVRYPPQVRRIGREALEQGGKVRAEGVRGDGCSVAILQLSGRGNR